MDLKHKLHVRMLSPSLQRFFSQSSCQAVYIYIHILPGVCAIICVFAAYVYTLVCIYIYRLAKTTTVDYGRPCPARRTSRNTWPADVHAVTTWTCANHWKQNQWIHKHKLHVRMLSPSLQRFSCSLSHLLLGKPLEHQTSGCTCHAQLDYVLLSIM